MPHNFNIGLFIHQTIIKSHAKFEHTLIINNVMSNKQLSNLHKATLLPAQTIKPLKKKLSVEQNEPVNGLTFSLKLAVPYSREYEELKTS